MPCAETKAVLYLDGVKYGDTQMTALGVLGSISFMSVSRSKPLDRLSAVRPLTSIFHPNVSTESKALDRSVCKSLICANAGCRSTSLVHITGLPLFICMAYT